MSQVNSVAPQGSLEAVAPEPSADTNPMEGELPTYTTHGPAAWSQETASSNAGAWENTGGGSASC